MRALLLALLITTTVNCSSKKEGSSPEPAPAGAEPAKVGEAARPVDPTPPAPPPEPGSNETPKEHRAADDLATNVEVARKEAEAVKQKVIDDAAKLSAKLQSGIDESERKLAALKVRAKVVTGSMKKNADAAMVEVEARRATLKADMVKLNAATGAAWDTARLQVEADATALAKAVDAFELTLKG